MPPLYSQKNIYTNPSQNNKKKRKKKKQKKKKTHKLKTNSYPQLNTKKVDTRRAQILQLVTTEIILENLLDQHLLVDLAHRIPRNMVHQPQHLRDLVARQRALQRPPHLQRRPLALGHVLPVEDHHG